MNITKSWKGFPHDQLALFQHYAILLFQFNVLTLGQLNVLGLIQLIYYQLNVFWCHTNMFVDYNRVLATNRTC